MKQANKLKFDYCNLKGLEDQLLAEVVKADRPDLEEQKADLTRQQNEYKILLKSLEDDLLVKF